MTTTLDPLSTPGRALATHDGERDLARERRCGAVLEALNEGLALGELICDADGLACDVQLLEGNGAFQRLIGVPAERLGEMTLRQCLPDVVERWVPVFSRVIVTRTPASFEDYVPTLDKWLDVSASCTVPGQVAFLLVDITDHKRAEEAALGQLALAEAVFTHSISPLVVLDRNYNFLRVNAAYAAACGRDIAAFSGRNHFEMYPTDVKLTFDEVVRTRQPYRVHGRPFVFPDQPERGVTYWDWTLVPILDRAGEVEHLIFSLIDVTERKVAEDSLRASEACHRQQATELELIYRTAPVGLCVIDPALRYVHINEHLAELNGVPVEQHLGRTVRDVLPWIADRVEPLLQRVIATGEPVLDFQGTAAARDGVQRDWVSQFWPLKSEDGSVFGINVVAEEITERRRLEEARRREQEFRSLAENSTDIIARFDRDLRRIYVNPAIETILDRPRSELLNKTHREIGLPNHVAEALDRELRRVFETRQAHETAVIVPTPAGERYLDARLVPEFGADGEVKTVLTITRDLTERKRAEDALYESEQKYRALVENLYEGIWLLDREARTAYANARLAELLGYSPWEMLGKPVFDFMHPRCVEEAREYLERGKTEGRAEFDFELRRKDGAPIWAHFAAAPLFSEVDGHYDGVLAGVIDVTQRKRAEEALQRREQEFAALVERAPDIIARFDRALQLVYVNPAIERLSGRPREWFLGKAARACELTMPEVAKFEHALKQVFDTGEERVIENKNTTSEGERYFQTRLVPEFGPDGSVDSVLVVERDIDDLKRAQQALEEQTLTDPLTGIGNRRFLERFAGREWSREARHHQPIAAIMVDIDHFKAYNDHYGHAQGDTCLRQVAETLRGSLRRPADTLVRYGGEEFVVLLPESNLSAAQIVAERMRQAVESQHLPHPASEAGEAVSVSLGCAAVEAHEGRFDELIEAADTALYRAKEKGRNRVESFG